ncbi:hypothetical protein, partial [Anoxynatronum buryatiense]|uniref:hypothetical protein n=1 Tax=Anoxynatronum buryatiense TaxID=489973 RepID=UPI0024B73F9E
PVGFVLIGVSDAGLLIGLINDAHTHPSSLYIVMYNDVNVNQIMLYFVGISMFFIDFIVIYLGKAGC